MRWASAGTTRAFCSVETLRNGSGLYTRARLSRADTVVTDTRRIVAGVVLLIGAVVGAGSFAAGCGGGSDEGLVSIKAPGPPVGRPQLPDIAPAPPQDAQITHEKGRWLLRFSTSLLNIGDGDFVLRAERVLDDWTVYEDIQYSKSGARVLESRASLVWGGDGHNHWHVERIAVGRLAPWTSGRPPKPRTGVADSKVGFCYYDNVRYLDDAAQNPGYSRFACGGREDRSIGMGLSYGWIDRYDFRLPGQSIDVTDLPDGKYRLWLDVDEQKWFREKRRNNNVTWEDFDLVTQKNGARAVTNKVSGPPIKLVS